MYLKKIVSLLLASLSLLIVVAQNAPAYQKQWKHIDSLIDQRGLPASALAEVNKIYAQAKKEGNDVQIIKALIYRMNLASMKEEDATQKNILSLEQELAGARQPARSILENLLATQYWNYFQQHRWQMYNRTETLNFNKSDIATWSAADFHKRISDLYLASLQNEKLLQQTRLEAFDPIIVKGNTRNLRPTLFDLLAHSALNYLKNDEHDIRRPSYAFEITQQAVFAPAADFIHQQFVTKDSLSVHHKALLVFQQLIAFHLNDPQPDALIDVDIERLAFAQQYAVLENKDEAYYAALQHIASQYAQYPAADQAWYLLADWYASKASSYSPQDTSNRFAYAQALSICEKVLAQKNNSEGYINCYNLAQTIRKRSLQLQAEKVNVPEQPFRVLVSYKNVAQVYMRLVKLDSKTRELLAPDNWDEGHWKKILQLPVTRSFSQALPDPKDYQSHAVEIKADALPVGDYALIASTSNDFNPDKKDLLTVQFFAVSNLSYIHSHNEYFVLNRETGQPIPNANVQVLYVTTDRHFRNGENIRTDKNGHFTIIPSKKNNDNSFRIELSTDTDHLLPEDFMYAYTGSYDEGRPEKNTSSTFLFTDRSLYRPGQIVYFKGIMVNVDVNMDHHIIAGQKNMVYLVNTNRQKIDSLPVTSNDFGSYAGKFTLPANTLNGTFHLEDGYTHEEMDFSVEEYKRPHFFVEISRPAGTYKLGDSMQVTGTAKAYAGNMISGAQVNYRVVRKTIIPMFLQMHDRYIWPPHAQDEMQIAYGTAITDAKGTFTVPFKAIPDNRISKKDQPVFYYEVHADITDINGETRSANTMIPISWQALLINIDLPSKLQADSLKSILVTTSNLDHEFQKSAITLTIRPLKTPGKIFRQRYWQQPDQFVMEQQEYYRLFPYDIYKDETDFTKWDKEQPLFSKTDTTARGIPFTLSNTHLKAGWYEVEATAKDQYGEEVKDRKYVQVSDQNTVPGPMAMVSIEGNTIAEPGNNVTYAIRTNVGNIFAIHDIKRNGKELQRNFLPVNGNSSRQLPVTEKDRGNIALTIVFVKNNRVYTDKQLVDVPYTNKQLHISYTTYRDKTLPGSEEKWSVKISGIKGDQVAAEILTAMYDASLDQYKSHAWGVPGIWTSLAESTDWAYQECFGGINGWEKNIEQDFKEYEKKYDALLPGEDRVFLSLEGHANGIMAKSEFAREGKNKIAAVVADSTVMDNKKALASQPPLPSPSVPPVALPRTNFNETAFFFPNLQTDSLGNTSFSFTMPEALTQWKWMLLAHTRELAFGLGEKTIITQKQLMAQPNAPRFLREGDRMDFSGKIVNMTDKEITGQVELQFIDPTTHQSIDGWFRNMFPNQYFTAGAYQSIPVNFTIEVPFQYNRPVTYRLIARADSLSDGEENILPVISNRLLVTESLPLPIRGNGTRTFNFEKLVKSGNSETLNHHALTVEFTTNPAWYAVQALPYLMEYPYECAEQNFNRYYSNALASYIIQSAPRIKAIFEKWKTADTSALISNLQKNEELKNILLEETPWVLQAGNETQQKKNIALLFDVVHMTGQLSSSLQKMQQSQLPNGSFPWFKGGQPDRYITQYILSGLGHLQKLGAVPATQTPSLQDLTRTALRYADQKIKEDYNNLVKRKASLENNNIGYTQIQYLYTRSFFNDYPVPGDVFPAYNYYRKQAQRFWLQQTNKYMQGMMALSLFRTGDVQTAKNILASLRQHALVNEEMGMYWKDITGGYYWYQSPVEAQSLLIEAFKEIAGDTEAIDDMRTWLLKQKQTQNWKTTKATADACYALLLQGINRLSAAPDVQIRLGNLTLNSKDQQQEAGTGYFKKVITGKDITPGMGNIQVSVSSPVNGKEATSAWGAVYWQYFENLENITPAATPLKLTKKLFVETNTDRGPVLQPINEGAALHVGDKVKVRIELHADRDLEYVHMKDMRAACMEPVNVLSQYKWQGGLGYYESTKDASTSFFFNWLPKGVYVFEYPLFVTHTGSFSNGITSIQCMYAPEFSSHSEGIKVTVEDK